MGIISLSGETNPEFSGLFDSFVFDAVVKQGGLDGHSRFLDILAALLRMVLGSRTLSATHRRLKEQVSDYENQTEMALSTDFPEGERLTIKSQAQADKANQFLGGM